MFRAGPAFARAGRVSYGWTPDLEGRFRARLEERLPDPILEGIRLYLELIYVHPFADGNARAARLALEHALRSGGLPTPELEGLVRTPKPAGHPTRPWELTRLLCRGLLRGAGVCLGSIG